MIGRDILEMCRRNVSSKCFKIKNEFVGMLFQHLKISGAIGQQHI